MEYKSQSDSKSGTSAILSKDAKDNLNGNLHRGLTIGLLTAGIFSALLVLYYLVVIGKGYYHSDCTDTILWAEAACDAGALVNKSFYYAELMPLGGQLFMIPFVALFGVEMKAQLCGMVCFFILFVLAVVFLCRSMKWDYKWIAVLLSVLLLTLSSSTKLREIFWEHIIYYSLGVWYLIVSAALVIRCTQSKDPKKKRIWMLLAALWLLVCSMNGTQIFALCSFPIIAALAMERFLDFKTPVFHAKNMNRYILMIVLVLGAIWGLVFGKLVNMGVVASYANGYSSFSASSKWGENLLHIFPEFFTLLGVNTNTNMIMFSFEGIMNLLRILCGIILLVAPIIMAVRYKSIKNFSCRFMLLVHHIMSAVILAGWVFGKLSAANWRLSPIIATSVICCVSYMKQIVSDKRYLRMAAVIAVPLACMWMITSVGILTMNKQSANTARLNSAADYLSEQKFQYGYATFWNANILTLLSDSKVKVREVKFDGNGYMQSVYQCNRNWYASDMGYDRYFVLMTDQEYERYYQGYEQHYPLPAEVLSITGYKILVYNENIF